MDHINIHSLSTLRINLLKYLFLIFLFLFPTFSQAQVLINEIMYDLSGTDTGREWIEVYNEGAVPIDLSNYKFSEGTVNHSLKVINGNQNILPGEYAIIADDSVKFQLDWSNLSINLFDSTFSLNNTTATLTLKDSSGAIINQASYSSSQGANGDGSSLQRSSSGWISGVPTPGSKNTDIAFDSNTPDDTRQPTSNSTSTEVSNSNSNNTKISSHYSYVSVSDFVTPLRFSVSAGRDRLAAVGNLIEFQAESNMTDRNPIYSWNFGDGSRGDGKQIEHIYEYPGEYVVVLNGSTDQGKSVSRIKVRVVDPKIKIEEANEKFIRIKNESPEEINLFGWELAYRGFAFKFPADTIILPKTTVTFTTNTTKLLPTSQNEVILKPTNIRYFSQSATTSIAVIESSKTTIEISQKIEKLKAELALIQKVKTSKPFISKAVNPINKKDQASTTTQSLTSNNNSNTASPLLGLKPEPLASSTNFIVKRSWFETLKLFLTGKSK